MINDYVKAAWILKIRLQSCRKLLWKNTFSIIDFEFAALQNRKSIEAVSQLCLLLAEIEFEDLPARIRNAYKTDEILKYLKRIDKLKIPNFARLDLVSEQSLKNGPRNWRLDITPSGDEDFTKILAIHSNTQKILHDRKSYYNAIDRTLQVETMFPILNTIRSENQWMWNRFWQHHTTLRDQLFFINLGPAESTSCPTVISEKTLSPVEVDLDFLPESFADFTSPVTWETES